MVWRTAYLNSGEPLPLIYRNAREQVPFLQFKWQSNNQCLFIYSFKLNHELPEGRLTGLENNTRSKFETV